MVITSANVINTNIPEQLAKSDQPWLYLVGVLLLVVLIGGGMVIKWLFKLAEEYRADSKKREESMSLQIDNAIAANEKIVETQKDLTVAIIGVQNNMQELKIDTNNRLEILEKKFEKQGA